MSVQRPPIDWLIYGLRGDWQQGLGSIYASNRYRAIVPATELRQLAQDVRFLPMESWSDESGDSRAGLLVVSKLVPNADAAKTKAMGERVLQGVAAARAAGTRIIVDFCDDAFQRDAVDWYWRRLAPLADLCVAASPHLAKAVSGMTHAAIEVIGDPAMSPSGSPKVFRRQRWVERWLSRQRQAQRLRIVWFGHESNLVPALKWARRLAELGSAHPWSLQLVTRENDKVAHVVQGLRQDIAPHGSVELIPWSESKQWEAIDGSDLVIIPANLDDATKQVKSSNRLTDALNMGRYVVASPVPSYLPYADHATLTDDPVRAVLDYLGDPEGALQRIARGQALVAELAGPAVIGRQWLGAIDRARSLQNGGPATTPGASTQTPSQPAAATSGPIRLNLGCGDKLLAGYVNVDVAASRAGKSPDVLCDLRDLSRFPDDHADEILSVHVVEHFWRWEVEAVLREWTRVLKPGGKMILECPNLRTACEQFLADPARGASAGRDGQRTMWVFYGDPQWKDPLMVHRWGYTPETLAELMLSVGLFNARQEPAQYKLREPRDMRIVAEKPLVSSNGATHDAT